MFKEQDTSWLQLESVIKCADRLGYGFNGRSFYKCIDIFGKVKKHFVSFNDMQRIHNSGLTDKTCQIVEKSTLQWHKKKKQFIAQNNMVKFV